MPTYYRAIQVEWFRRSTMCNLELRLTLWTLSLTWALIIELSIYHYLVTHIIFPLNFVSTSYRVISEATSLRHSVQRGTNGVVYTVEHNERDNGRFHRRQILKTCRTKGGSSSAWPSSHRNIYTFELLDRSLMMINSGCLCHFRSFSR